MKAPSSSAGFERIVVYLPSIKLYFKPIALDPKGEGELKDFGEPLHVLELAKLVLSVALFRIIKSPGV